ncbi:MAG: 4Fe-4S binding protein [Candidatus Hadarchaeales archaeon]
MQVELCGLKLVNPIIAGAGPFGKNAEMMSKAAEGGAAAMVTQTIKVESCKMPRPYLAKTRDNLLSADGWSEIRAEIWIKEELKKAKKIGLPLIASVGGEPEEIEKLAGEIAGAGADAIEISARHSGKNPSKVAEAVKAAKSSANIPVFVKVGMYDKGPLEIAISSKKAGADGIVCMDALWPALEADIEVAMPAIGTAEGAGLLSGPAIKPLALYWTAKIAKNVSIPIIGCGGISSGRDAIEFIQAGASAVQICTAAIFRGPKVFGIIADEILKFLRTKNYSLEEVRGKLLGRLPDWPHLETKPPEIIATRCNSCGICVQQCPSSAMWTSARGIRIDLSRCDGCGLCVSVCPSRALRW